MNIIETVIAAIKDKLTTDTAELLVKLSKLEKQIEKAIAKDLRHLSTLKNAEFAIQAQIKGKNRNVDVAYKLLNNVSGLTK
jgi:hypothetical protein